MADYAEDALRLAERLQHAKRCQAIAANVESIAERLGVTVAMWCNVCGRT